MKLHRRTYQIFWDVHAWGGMVAALLLYVMFFTGAFALFYPELDLWAAPRATLLPPPAAAPLDALLTQAVKEEGALFADRLAFVLDEAAVGVSVMRGDSAAEYQLNPARGRLEPRISGLGAFLYELHYLGMLPGGIYVAGVASMALLLAIVTGVAIHWKDLVRQWFQFRQGRPVRTWSSDLHKVLGVFGLPFQLLYAWTGVVLCLGSIAVAPALVLAVFQGDERAARRSYGQQAELPAATGRASATLPSIDSMAASAARMFPGVRPRWIGVQHVGDEGSYVSYYGTVPDVPFGSVEVVFRGSDGAVLHRIVPVTSTAAHRFDTWFYGLHYARFGGYGVRVLYALMAFATCAVILTGNLVWLERRDARRVSAGNRLLERLTVGVGAGTPLATAALFAANRALPAALPGRGEVEEWVFLAVLVVATGVAVAVRQAVRVLAWELNAAAAVFAGAVALDLAVRPDVLAGNPLHRGVLASLVVLAVCSALAGAGLLKRGRREPPRGE